MHNETQVHVSLFIYKNFKANNILKSTFSSFSTTIDPELNFYEIPVPKGTEPENLPKENDYEETTASNSSGDKGDDLSTSPVPPPLPPRRDRTASDAQSRSSCGSILEEVKPHLPLRPQLTPKSEIFKGSLERLIDDDHYSHGKCTSTCMITGRGQMYMYNNW